MFERKSFLHIASLHLIAIFLVIMNVSNVNIGGLAKTMPLFDLMAVFYFCAFKRVFGLWFIFLLGIWNDSLGGNPLGTTALCYIILIKVFDVLNNRMLIRENFQQVWQQFIIFCFLFLSMKWVILSIFHGSPYNVINPILQLILSSIFYVVAHKFFDYLSKKLLGDN